VAAHEITVCTSLIEARLLCGPKALFKAMRMATATERMWCSRDFFSGKLREQNLRHHKYHDTAYNLEPNIKEGPGGLRDIHTIGWVAKRHFGATELRDLIAHGFLTEAEYQTLIEGQNFLWQIRFALHILTGRREDRLLFDYQQTLAKQFGYSDKDHSLGVEQFMQRYFRTAGEISRLNEMLLQLFQESIRLVDDPGEPLPLNRRFQVRRGFIEATRDAVFRRCPFALLEIFLILQQHPELKGVRASTIRLIRDHRHLIDDKFRNDLRARSLFMEIIRQPRGLTHELRRMHRYGILAAYLPVFGRIVGRMQYDLFHVYSVDEHTLFVLRNLRRFCVPEFTYEFPLCSAIIKQLPKPELLYIAGLFHDIAKGRGGDHSELGAEDALAFCLHHGLSQYDARVVSWLVRHHLMMSLTIQREDINDPEVINNFARKVGDQVHLAYLYLLTVADIRATNPTLWNSWKDSLLTELYIMTKRALRRGLENPIDKEQLIRETQLAAEKLLKKYGVDEEAILAVWQNFSDDYFLRYTADEIAWHTQAVVESRPADLPLVLLWDKTPRGGTEVFVYTEDMDYVFARTVAALTQLGLTIMDARIITSRDGYTLDSYSVLEQSGEPIRQAFRLHEIVARLKNHLRGADARPAPVRRTLSRQLKHFNTPTQILFSVDEPNQRTVMELITADRPGLLSGVGQAFVDSGVRLQGAKVATIGARAEDVFFITDQENQPLRDEQQLECLRKAILSYLQDGQDSLVDV
jgi:[Protein-PII] uridylyltransferase